MTMRIPNLSMPDSSPRSAGSTWVSEAHGAEALRVCAGPRTSPKSVKSARTSAKSAGRHARRPPVVGVTNTHGYTYEEQNYEHPKFDVHLRRHLALPAASGAAAPRSALEREQLWRSSCTTRCQLRWLGRLWSGCATTAFGWCTSCVRPRCCSTCPVTRRTVPSSTTRSQAASTLPRRRLGAYQCSST